MPLIIRPETVADHATISALTTAAFGTAPHASGTEAAIIEALRAAGALTLSLVADDGGAVGHVAFSPVTIDGQGCGWFGLGPVSVAPDRQGQGIGAALIREGLARLTAAGAKGCVLLGDPGYYRRFGFETDPALALPNVPAEYFLRLVLAGTSPSGTVAFHPGFYP